MKDVKIYFWIPWIFMKEEVEFGDFCKFYNFFFLICVYYRKNYRFYNLMSLERKEVVRGL